MKNKYIGLTLRELKAVEDTYKAVLNEATKILKKDAGSRVAREAALEAEDELAWIRTAMVVVKARLNGEIE